MPGSEQGEADFPVGVEVRVHAHGPAAGGAELDERRVGRVGLGEETVELEAAVRVRRAGGTGN